jgi:hypothetical protein
MTGFPENRNSTWNLQFSLWRMCDAVPFSLADKYQRFGGSCIFNKYLEDAVTRFFWNVGTDLQNAMLWHHRTQESSLIFRVKFFIVSIFVNQRYLQKLFLLTCEAVLFDRTSSPARRNLLLPCSGSKIYGNSTLFPKRRWTPTRVHAVVSQKIPSPRKWYRQISHETYWFLVEFEAATAAVRKISISFNITACCSLKFNRYSGGRARSKKSYLLTASFMMIFAWFALQSWR